MTPATIIFGGGAIGGLLKDYTTEGGKELLTILKENGVKEIDTAKAYPNSEKELGKLGAGKSFVIHTKAPAWEDKALSRESIFEGVEESLEELGVDSVQTYYFHHPDATTPIEESLSAINDLHKAGKFKQFGLSNFPISEITKINTHCLQNNYVLPTVYQGNYNPASRRIESDLFPVLRSLDMSFVAYSPLAGGFFVRDVGIFKEGADGEAGGRWDKETTMGAIYHRMYSRPKIVEALGVWEDISRESGVSKAALAYRWVTYSSSLDGSKGDAIIIGARTALQLVETMEAIKAGPLDEKVVERINAWWELVKDEAPYDNFQD